MTQDYKITDIEQLEAITDEYRKAKNELEKERQAHSSESPEYKRITEKISAISELYIREYTARINSIEIERFNKIKDSPEQVLESAKHEIDKALERFVTAGYYPNGKRPSLKMVKNVIEYSIRYHLTTLKNDKVHRAALDEYILEALKDSGLIDAAELKNLQSLEVTSISVSFPTERVVTTDKVSRVTFANQLEELGSIDIRLSNPKSKKPIKTRVFLDLSDAKITIDGKKELEPYDNEVHRAITTCYYSGGNEYMTPQMIFRAMTGNADARLGDKQREQIDKSLDTLMYGRLVIDGSIEEAEAYNFEEKAPFKYEGTIIQAEKITTVISGEKVEVVRILRPPALFEYAEKKSQISRLPIEYLDTPISKNMEVINLQGYLLERITAMQANPSNKKINKNILYETIYEYLRIEAPNANALKNKQYRIRQYTKEILDYWKEAELIAGYTENKKGRRVDSITIKP